MKIRNLFPIRFTLILPALLCFVILASCSAEKKETLTLNRKERESSFQYSSPSEKEKEELLAVINEDEVPVYYSDKDGSESVDYYHRGDLIGVYAETSEDAPGMYELSYGKGLMHKKYFDFITLPPKYDEETTLTNSKEVNHEGFPVRASFVFEHMCYEQNKMPPYLDSEDDWVVFSKTDGYWESGYSMTLHIKDLPQYFDILIYAPDESRYLTFCKERREIWLGEYEEFLDDEEKKILNRIWPLHVVYLETPLTVVSGTCKTEIRSKDGNMLFSGYFDYPETQLRIEELARLPKGNYFMQYASEKPFYIVIYKTTWESLPEPVYGFERVPVKAFAAYPENGVWSGILYFRYEFEILEVLGEYRLYFYRLDENNPEDYTQGFGEYWYNKIGDN